MHEYVIVFGLSINTTISTEVVVQKEGIVKMLICVDGEVYPELD